MIDYLRNGFYPLLITTIISSTAKADWTANINNTGYYTSDVALFSVTRRLSLKDDPTQPVVDRPKQGADFVYEPDAKIKWSGTNSLGKISWSTKAGGYVFVDQTKFSHSVFETQVSQTFSTKTKIHLRYNFIPDLYLGQNTYIDGNSETYDQDEIVTTNYWSIQVDQPLNNNLTASLYGRYGLRNYNAPFQYRNTQFWTLGPRLDWAINDKTQLLVGYHYELGNAASEKSVNAHDNVSYTSNYTSAELTIQLLERLSTVFIIDYEKNNFTSNNINDLEYGTSEDVYQGEIACLYKLHPSATVKLGWQYGDRKLTSDDQNIVINNVWLSLISSF